MRNYLLPAIFLVCSLGLNAQNYNMTNGTVNTCSGTFYDSGGSGSTYSTYEYYTYTICPSTPGAKVSLNFTSFNVEANYDMLTIYDGPNTASPSLGSYDNNVPLSGVVQATTSNASGCLTFVFESDGSIQYAGWQAAISCSQPCQTIQAVFSSSSPAASGSYINVCQGQTVSFSGSATFPQNGTSYTQSLATSTFTWDFGDGTTATGQNVTHTYATEGGYDVDLVVTDNHGCISYNDIDIRVRVSTTPTFSGTNVSPTSICLGQSATLTGSPHMTPWSQPTGATLAGTTYLPDGTGVSYTTQLCFTEFSPGQTVTAASDIVSLCMDLEHSYWGDLTISIACPNGSSMILTDGYSSTATGYVNLGEPVDDDYSSTVGDPYTYCFTPSAATTMDALVTAGPPTYSYTDNDGTAVSSMSYIPGGNYAAEGAWSSLIGCPLNGCWVITVTDHLGSDDGSIFQWGINFNPALYPSLWGFTPTLATQQWSGTANSGLTTTTSNPATVNPTVAGNYTYTYTITDNYGCSYDTTVTLNVSAGPTITATASPSSVCPGQSSTLTASGGATYNWSTGATGASVSVTPGSTTTYTVTGTSAAGCIGTATVTVTASPPAAISASASPAAICSGTATTVSASGGSTYVWSPSGSGASFTASPTTTTTYSVTGTTAAGCTGSATVMVTLNPNPTVTASASPASVCPGQASTLSASGASGYVWSCGSTMVNPLVTTTYTVTGTSAAGCTGTATVTVVVNPNATITASALPTSICSGQSATLTASGGATYVWNTGSTMNPLTVNPTSTTSYTVTGTTALGCSGTAALTITVNPLPAVSASASPANICFGSSSTLTGSGASSYSWSTGQNATSISVSPVVNTTYTVTGTSSAGCTGTATVSINISASLSISAAASPSSVCLGQSSTISASGASTYTWSPAGTGASFAASPTATTTYSVTGSDAWGCTGTTTVTLTVNPLPTVTASANPTGICAGQSSVITATGANSYVWSSGSSGASFTATPSGTSTYSVTGTSSAGCTGSATVTLTVNPLPTVTATATPAAICAGQSSTISASGANSYVWNTGASSASISVSPVSTTNYTVTGTSVAGCTGSATVSLTINPLPVVSATASPSMICAGQSSTISASGANSYVWSPGGSGASFSATPGSTTTYSVTGTSTAGCTGTAVVTLTVNPLPTVSASASPSAICVGQSSTISASGANSYVWSPGGSGTSFTANPITTTIYSVTGTTTAGCTGSSSVSLTVNPLPNIVATASPMAVCAGFSTTVSASGGSSYVWSSGQTVASFNEMPAATTTYNVTGTDAHNCSNTASVTVTLMPGLTVNVTPEVDDICEGSSTTLTASSPGSGVGYIWDTGAGSASITVSPLTTTTYSVTGTDAQGCSGTTTATVSVDPLPVANFSADPLIGCDPTTVHFTDLSTGNISIWDWEFGDGDISGLQHPSHTYTSGIYNVTLTVTTVAGCQSSLTMSNYVTISPNPVAAFTANPAVVSQDEPTISFINQSTQATLYNWSFGDNAGNDYAENPIYTYSGSGSYVVTLWAENDAGCTDSASMTVNVKPTYTFYLANAFSPNGDGRNDVLRPFGTGWDTDSYSMRIYSRWGDLVFSTTDINHGWDGFMPNGAEAIQDVYSVIISIRGMDGKENHYYKGVGLIR